MKSTIANFMLTLALLCASPALAYQPDLASCVSGVAGKDTCVYYEEQIRPGGMLTLPPLITEQPIVILWSTAAQPMCNVITDRPIMQTIAVVDTVVSAEGDTTYVDQVKDMESGQYFTENILCAAVSLLMVDGTATARLTWMNGNTEEYPLSKVRLYVVRRVSQ